MTGRALFILVHITAAIPAMIWLWLPPTRQRVGRFTIAGIIALGCYLFALSNYELIGRWDLLVWRVLIRIVPKSVIVGYTTFVGPTIYLFSIWLLSYVGTFQILRFLKARNDQAPR